MRDGIAISEKHGVNPSVTHCYFCGESVGVALMGRLPGDKEAPRDCVVDMEPCKDCEALMEQGVIMIEVRDGEDGPDPFRTGNIWVLKDEAIERMVDETLAGQILAARFTFIPEEAARMIGLHKELPDD